MKLEKDSSYNISLVYIKNEWPLNNQKMNVATRKILLITKIEIRKLKKKDMPLNKNN
ncbi:uncharacterized protein RHIMIDRAFT_263632 [Rhizopus microsporus ATCC 52813]|uniref:Uncharacterized protein n=1 Tax=Rhizopus microsporus ATCC 52813 TaxID=1340429 RepID=A0A2G4SKN8_RHIZD|nr:uncharacterized protein RHIMIDRAFT_263632 [Rhizopus microsporus ATCC 52813]PHZ09347.1 hypothetical protein RHIMIDRAFT_263632 [Rhizopus microsporus ATCC 52813]